MYMHIIISPNVLVNPHLCQILIFLEHQARSLQPTNGLSFHGTFRRSAGLFLLEMAKRSVLQGRILQGLVVNNPFFLLGFGWVTRLHILAYEGFSGGIMGLNLYTMWHFREKQMIKQILGGFPCWTKPELSSPAPMSPAPNGSLWSASHPFRRPKSFCMICIGKPKSWHPSAHIFWAEISYGCSFPQIYWETIDSLCSI